MERGGGLDVLKRRPSLEGRSAGVQWAVLLGLSALFVLSLVALRIPAALLIGPMAAGVVVALSGAEVKTPRSAFFIAQGVIGCLMGGALPLSTMGEIGRDWPLMLGAVVSVVIASNALGWALSRWSGLPGTTAIWGSSPGAASAMTLMSESYGADIRLVAFMQYTRVVVVVLAASLVSRFYAPVDGPAAPQIVWFPPVEWLGLVETLGVAAGGATLGRLLRVPAGPLLVPFGLTLILHWLGIAAVSPPEWLLALAYAFIGWSIGLRFTRPIFLHAAKALPKILGSIFALIVICAGFAATLVVFAGVDPLTAFLATSPGGADSVAIIAASSPVDHSFVMALQTARLIVVLVTGPPIARFIASRSRPRDA